jgi:hypothetical protein
MNYDEMVACIKEIDKKRRGVDILKRFHGLLFTPTVYIRVYGDSGYEDISPSISGGREMVEELTLIADKHIQRLQREIEFIERTGMASVEAELAAKPEGTP